MPLARQFLPVVPKGVDQRTERSQLPAGRLLHALDVHQRDAGTYSKRHGTAQVTRAVIGDADIDSGRGLTSTGSALVERSGSNVYVYSDAADAWVNKAAVRPIMARAGATTLNYGYRPTLIDVGGFRYHFAGDVGQLAFAQDDELQVGAGAEITNQPSWWYYRVVDRDTGAEVVGPTAISTVKGWQAKPVVAGGYVWLFVGAGGAPGRYLYAVKFDPANPTTSPTVTTFFDAGASGEIHGWDVYAFPAGAVVVALGTDIVSTNDGAAMRLNPATGLPAASPGVVGLNTGLTVAEQCCVQFYRNEDGTTGDTVYRFLGVGADLDLTAFQIDAPTLAFVSATELAIDGGDPTPTEACGYWHDDVYTTFAARTANDPRVAQLRGYIHEDDGTRLNDRVIKIGMHPVSAPFEFVDGRWGLIAAHVDNFDRAQAAYYLITELGEILGRVLYGQGGDATQRAAYVADAGNPAWISPEPSTVDGAIALNSWDGTQYVTREVAFHVDDDDRQPGPLVSVADGQHVSIPGAWPHLVAGFDVSECLPHAPEEAPLCTEEDADGFELLQAFYRLAYVYARRDSAGNVHRSAPSPSDTVEITTTGKTVRLVIPTLTLTNSLPGEWSIEIYASSGVDAPAAAAAPLQLQIVVANDPTEPTVQIDLYQETLLEGEELYTEGGAELANDPPPPFGWAAAWGRRLIVGDTDEPGEWWVSKDKAEGHGFEFSVSLIGLLPDGAERIYAGGAVDENYFALLKADGIYTINGPGPDSTGRGMYEATRLPGLIGCTNPRSLVTTPAGLVFQATDGRPRILTRDLRVLDIGAGVESYKDRIVTAAAYDPTTQQVRLFLEDA